MNRALTKADIVEAIYEKTDRNRADVKNTVEILLGLMKQVIKKDDALLVGGFREIRGLRQGSAQGPILKRMKPLRSSPQGGRVPSVSQVPCGIERRGS